MKLQVPECIADFGRLKNPLHTGLLTTFLVGEYSGAVTILLLGQDIGQDIPAEVKEHIINTNTALFLSGLVTGSSAWIYYRMPRKLDNTIEEKIKPWIKMQISKIL